MEVSKKEFGIEVIDVVLMALDYLYMILSE